MSRARRKVRCGHPHRRRLSRRRLLAHCHAAKSTPLRRLRSTPIYRLLPQAVRGSIGEAEVRSSCGYCDRWRVGRVRRHLRCPRLSALGGSASRVQGDGQGSRSLGPGRRPLWYLRHALSGLWSAYGFTQRWACGPHSVGPRGKELRGLRSGMSGCEAVRSLLFGGGTLDVDHLTTAGRHFSVNGLRDAADECDHLVRWMLACIIHEGPDSTAKGRDRRRKGSRTSPPASGAGV